MCRAVAGRARTNDPASNGSLPDATVGPILKQKADAAGTVYTNADGDQPGVLMRLIEYCRGCGFAVRCAVNCKGFMNIRATPDSIKEWAIKQNTSLIIFLLAVSSAATRIHRSRRT